MVRVFAVSVASQLFREKGMVMAPVWLQVSMQTLSILQSHYPERLGMAICYHAPRLFSFSWRVQSSHLSLHFPQTLQRRADDLKLCK